jgi:hypothetical protein
MLILGYKVKDGCTSSCCLVKRNPGQCTNGGCSCFDDVPREHRLAVKKKWDVELDRVQQTKR